MYKLRPLKLDDAVRMAEMMQDLQTTRYLQIGGPDYTLETAKRFIESTADQTVNLHRAVVDEQDVYQGTISLKNIDYEKKNAEYAISMHPEAQGKGAAKIATDLILEMAFRELNLHSVYLNVLTENVRANRFYQKVGFLFTHSSTMVHRDEKKELNWYIAEKPADQGTGSIV